MKKTLCIMLTTVMLLSLTGCQGLVATRIAEAVSSDELANNRVKAFLEAVEKGDKGEIKGMLAPKTIKKVEDIDAQIDALIDFYKGETKKIDDSGGREVKSTYDYGDVREIIESSYIITTTEEQYQLAIKDVAINDFNENNEGIAYVYIKKAEKDYEDNHYWGDYNSKRGIYIR